MGERKLSYNLMDMGFFSALGTSEHLGIGSKESYVGRGNPFTWDSNNGVTVVYDEEGRPWIKATRDVPEDLFILGPRFPQMTRGAFVPHSNDGGHFLYRVVLPLLIKP
jgi:hypothetical protein